MSQNHPDISRLPIKAYEMISSRFYRETGGSSRIPVFRPNIVNRLRSNHDFIRP